MATAPEVTEVEVAAETAPACPATEVGVTFRHCRQLMVAAARWQWQQCLQVVGARAPADWAPEVEEALVPATAAAGSRRRAPAPPRTARGGASGRGPLCAAFRDFASCHPKKTRSLLGRGGPQCGRSSQSVQRAAATPAATPSGYPPPLPQPAGSCLLLISQLGGCPSQRPPPRTPWAGSPTVASEILFFFLFFS
jgi:hypothetical protein